MKFAQTIGLVVVILALLMSQPAYAYLDPASGSLLAQLIVGGVAGLLVALKLFWHRIVNAMPWSKKPAVEHEEQPD
jgi:hypothetical protein